MNVAAFCQTDEPATMPQPAVQQQSATPPLTAKSAETQPPAKPQRTTSPVADAAQASKQARGSAPAAKMYRNHDLKDPDAPVANASATGAQGAPTSTAKAAYAQSGSYPAAATPAQTPAAFAAQAVTFREQVRVEKGKIIDLQTNIRKLQAQFAAWSAEYWQDEEAPVCWTSAYNSPYYKDWCSAGRDLKAQFEAAQTQFAQEKTRLEQMQEDIRRKGYGNAVYDPD